MTRRREGGEGRRGREGKVTSFGAGDGSLEVMYFPCCVRYAASEQSDLLLRGLGMLAPWTHLSVYQRISRAECTKDGPQSNDQSMRKSPNSGRSFTLIPLYKITSLARPAGLIRHNCTDPIPASSLATDALHKADRNFLVEFSILWDSSRLENHHS